VPFLALAATYWSYFAWQLAKNWRFWEMHVSGDSDLTLRLCFLSVYWIVFTAGAFLAAGPKVPAATRVVFSTLNDAAFFCLAAFAISQAHHDSLWIVSMVFGLVQLGLALAARKYYGPATPTGSTWLAKGLFFLTLAILIRLTGNSLAVILAVECSLLVFAASRLPSHVLASAGPVAGVLAMIAGMASLSESGTAGAAWLVAALLAGNAWFCGRRPDVSPRSLILALGGVALGFAILVNQLPDEWGSAGIAFLGLVLVADLPFHKCRELAFVGLLATAGSAMVQFGMLESAGLPASLIALGLLTATAATGPLVGRDDKLIRIPSGLLAIGAILLFCAWVTFHHGPLPITVAWALLALALFSAGFLLRARIFRLGGLGVLALALCRIVLFDVWLLDLPLRILSFLVLGSVLLLLGYFYNRYAERIRQWL